MAKTIEEIYREVKAKYVQEKEKKFDNGIVYEIVPPRSVRDNYENEKATEQKIAERNLEFQNRIREISNLPSVSNMGMKTLPVSLPLSSLPDSVQETPISLKPSISSTSIQEMSAQSEKKYCPYCSSDVNSNEKICPNCKLPVPEKFYRREATFTGSSVTFNIENILCNIENDVEPPRPVEIKTHQGNFLVIKPIMTDEKFVRYYPSYENRISVYCSLKKFTVIDFETANMYPDSVCQLGIVVIEGDNVVERKSYLIRPPYNDFRNADIHGITLNDVENEKTFAELWGEIRPFIENKLVGAYNARFDIGCLIATLENFNIEMPDFAYFDILQNVKEKFQENGWRSYKLQAVARKLKIKHEAHDALSDALAAASVQIKCDMTAAFSLMYAKNNNHFEVMTELFTSKDIFSFVRKRLKEITSSDINDYGKVIEVLSVVEKNDEAKYLKLLGEIFEKCEMYIDALEKYEKAYKLNDKIGVKGKIQKLKKNIGR